MFSLLKLIKDILKSKLRNECLEDTNIIKRERDPKFKDDLPMFDEF